MWYFYNMQCMQYSSRICPEYYNQSMLAMYPYRMYPMHNHNNMQPMQYNPQLYTSNQFMPNMQYRYICQCNHQYLRTLHTNQLYQLSIPNSMPKLQYHKLILPIRNSMPILQPIHKQLHKYNITVLLTLHRIQLHKLFFSNNMRIMCTNIHNKSYWWFM